MNNITYGTQETVKALNLIVSLINVFLKMKRITVISLMPIAIKYFRQITDLLNHLDQMKKEIMDLNNVERETLRQQISQSIDESSIAGKLADAILDMIINISEVFEIITLVKQQSVVSN